MAACSTPTVTKATLPATAKHNRPAQGLKVWVNPDPVVKDIVDIVAVPGLACPPEDSWCTEEKDDNGKPVRDENGRARLGYNWLADEKGLRSGLPNARIMLFQYNSAYMGKWKIKQTMPAIGISLLEALVGEREKCQRRPIIFIGHSMGGLVIAQALKMMSERSSDYPCLYECFAGCLFFGTPFHGSPDFHAAAMLKAWSVGFEGTMYQGMLDFLKPKNAQLEELRDDLVRHLRKLESPVVCYYETILESDIAVDKASATLDGFRSIEIYRNHRDLVRFEDEKDPLYLRFVRRHLQVLAQDAPNDVRERMKKFASEKIEPEDMMRIRSALEGDSVPSLKNMERRVVPLSWILDDPLYRLWDSNSTEHTSAPTLLITGSEGRGKTGTVIAILRRAEEVQVKDEHRMLAYCFCGHGDGFYTAEDVLKSIMLQLIKQNERLAEGCMPFVLSNKRHATKKSRTKTTETTQIPEQKIRAVALTLEILWACLLGMLDDASCDPTSITIANLHRLDAELESTQRFLDLLRADVMNAGAAMRSDHRWLFTVQPSIPSWNDLFGKSYVTTWNVDERLNETPTTMKTAMIINLNDSDYGSKIKLAVRAHAWKRLQDLGFGTKNSTGLRHWVRSVMGDKAPDNKWVDVACVQLKGLEAGSSDARIRRAIEQAEPDTATLLRRQWRLVLESPDVEHDELREVLLTLILTYRAPTESEALVLCGFKEPSRASDFRQIIRACYPLVILVSHKGDSTIEFASAEIREYLQKDAVALLGTNFDEQKRQHWWLAARCLNALREFFRATDFQPENDNKTSGDYVQVREHIQTDGCGSTSNHEESDNDERTDNFFFGEEDCIEGESMISSSQYETARSQGLLYAAKFWLLHGNQAGPDFAVYLSEDVMLESEATFLFQWLWLYKHLGDEFTGILQHTLRRTENDEVMNREDSLKDGEQNCTGNDWDDVTVSQWNDTFTDLAPGRDDISDHSERDFDSQKAFEVHHAFFTSLKPIHIAAAFGYTTLIQALIRSSTSQNVEAVVCGYTPIHFAASRGHEGAINALLGHGAEIDAGHGTVGTALHRAAANGHVGVMRCLLTRSSYAANVNAFDDCDGPVINTAILRGNVSGVRLLIQMNVALDGSDGHGNVCYEAPLVLSAQCSDLTTFEAILSAGMGKWKSMDLFDALTEASAQGRIDIVKCLLKSDVFSVVRDSDNSCDDQIESDMDDPEDNEAGQSLDFEIALAAACFNEQPDVVDIVLERFQTLPIDFSNAFRITARWFHLSIEETSPLSRLWTIGRANISQQMIDDCLFYAADNFRLTTVKWLLEKCGANPMASGAEWGNAITAAANDGELDIVQALLNKTSDKRGAIDHISGFALQAAAKAGHLSIVQYLLEQGASIDRVANHFNACEEGTALLAACVTSKIEVVRFLLENGANPNLGAGGFERPIIAATELGDADILACLLEFPGVEVNEVGGLKTDCRIPSYPIINAAQTLPVESLKILVQYGAKPNVSDEDEETALMLAASTDDLESVKYLCELDADMFHHNLDGFTALDIAIDSDSHGCAKYLQTRQRAIIRTLKSAADADLPIALELLQAAGKVETIVRQSDQKRTSNGMSDSEILLSPQETSVTLIRLRHENTQSVKEIERLEAAVAKMSEAVIISNAECDSRERQIKEIQGALDLARKEQKSTERLDQEIAQGIVARSQLQNLVKDLQEQVKHQQQELHQEKIKHEQTQASVQHIQRQSDARYHQLLDENERLKRFEQIQHQKSPDDFAETPRITFKRNELLLRTEQDLATGAVIERVVQNAAQDENGEISQGTAEKILGQSTSNWMDRATAVWTKGKDAANNSAMMKSLDDIRAKRIETRKKLA